MAGNKEEVAAVIGKVERKEAAPAAAGSSETAAGSSETEPAEIKLVEMPESHVRWILAQEIGPVFTLDDYPITTEDLYAQAFLNEKRELLAQIRESLLASRAEFAEHQAWVRAAYARDGRVMVPEHENPPVDEAQGSTWF